MPEYSGGKYKSGSGVISTIDFVEKVLLGELAMNNMDGFLNHHEIVSPPYSMIHPAEVNMPSFNIHTMLADEGFLVNDAFEVLKAVKLNKFGGFCSTEFSFVYSANQNTVYYCYNRKFDNVSSYKMHKPLIGRP